MNTTKAVLVSHFPLPFEGIASWTTMMNNLIKNKSEVDYVICPPSSIESKYTAQYFIKERTYFDRLKNRFDGKSRFNPYINQLKKILEKEEKITLNILENVGLLKAIISYINENNLKHRVYIHFFYYYFLPFTNNDNILLSIDELTLQTFNAYDYFAKHANQIPFKVSVNHNGVDSNNFKPVSQQKKNKLRQVNQLKEEDLIFMWCSQDRPKKGLQLILDLWRIVYEQHNKKVKLLVVGVNRNIEQEGVINIGRVPNQALPQYFQLSDFYLFPTLCQEGFGLSLAEALKCGCFCIASNMGAVPEVLDNGRFGKLVNRPNFPNQWIEAIDESLKIYLENERINPYLESIPKNIYDLQVWTTNMNKILKEAKSNFS